MVKIVIYFLFFGIFSNVFSETIYEHLQFGEKFFSEKNYKLSIHHFKSAIELNPSSIKGHLGFAKNSRILGSKADANNSYKVVLELEPTNKEAFIGIVELLSEDGYYNEALKVIELGLVQEPYHPGLLLSKVTVLLLMDKGDLALKILLDSQSKIETDDKYRVLLIRAYIATKQYSKAEPIISELINKHSDNPIFFIEKAKLNFHMIQDKKNQNADELTKDSLINLKTALLLDSDNWEAMRLIIYNLIWVGNYTEARDYGNIIKSRFMNDYNIRYISGYLNIKLKSINDAVDDFQKLLQLNEQDDLGRFAAEEFVIRELPEKHPFRNSLGKYRLQKFKLETSNFLYTNSIFSLFRASELIPTDATIKTELLEYYYKNDQLDKFLNVLEKIRSDKSEDAKINNKFETSVQKVKNSLSYLEGYTNLTGKLDESVRTLPEIFIFDPEPKEFLSLHPGSSYLLGKAIKYTLKMKTGIKIISNGEEEEIRRQIQDKKGTALYSDGIYYSTDVLEFLDSKRSIDNQIRYIGYGKYSELENSLKIEFFIYDRTKGKVINSINLLTSNRNALGEMMMLLSDKIAKSIPSSGVVIKIKDDSILLNLGSKDGIKVGTIIRTYRNGKNTGEFKIDKLDDFISRAIPVSKDWNKTVSIKDNIEIIETVEKKDGE